MKIDRTITKYPELPIDIIWGKTIENVTERDVQSIIEAEFEYTEPRGQISAYDGGEDGAVMAELDNGYMVINAFVDVCAHHYTISGEAVVYNDNDEVVKTIVLPEKDEKGVFFWDDRD